MRVLPVALLAASACDPTSGEPSVLAEAGLEAQSRGSPVWFAVEAQDCAFCTGAELDKLNVGAFPCPDGSGSHETCRVDEVDLFLAGLSEEDQARVEDALVAGGVVLRGRLSSVGVPCVPEPVETLHVTEAWLPAVDAEPAGTVVFERDNREICQSDPCPIYDERTVNVGGLEAIAELDFAPSGADDAAIDVAVDAAGSRAGLLVAGELYAVPGSDGPGRGRTVSQFWLRVLPE